LGEDFFLVRVFFFSFLGDFSRFSFVSSSGSEFFVVQDFSFSFSLLNMGLVGFFWLRRFWLEYNNCFKASGVLFRMISFSDIYEAMRKEKYGENLQVLSRDFLKEVSRYFDEKREVLGRKSDLFSDVAIKNKKKLENAQASFRDLLRIRKKKILNLAFVASQVGISKRDFENLLGFEKDLFEELVKSLERAEKNQAADMNGSGKDEVCRHRLVRFLEDVEEFLNSEGEAVGPFVKGEVANLECEIVEVLSKKVEVVDY
jgi:hypothetical protein